MRRNWSARRPLQHDDHRPPRTRQKGRAACGGGLIPRAAALWRTRSEAPAVYEDIETPAAFVVSGHVMQERARPGTAADAVIFLSIASVGFCAHGLSDWGRARVVFKSRRADDRDHFALFLERPEGSGERGTSGYKGFFYHSTPEASASVELSSVDITILMVFALYVHRDDPGRSVRLATCGRDDACCMRR